VLFCQSITPLFLLFPRKPSRKSILCLGSPASIYHHLHCIRRLQTSATIAAGFSSLVVAGCRPCMGWCLQYSPARRKYKGLVPLLLIPMWTRRNRKLPSFEQAVSGRRSCSRPYAEPMNGAQTVGPVQSPLDPFSPDQSSPGHNAGLERPRSPVVGIDTDCRDDCQSLEPLVGGAFSQFQCIIDVTISAQRSTSTTK
jgi:hypothetical protein